jgi:hypothetical protein
MDQKVTPLPSVLYTTEAKTLKKQVADDLTTPDPQPEEAEAAIKDGVIRRGESKHRSIWDIVEIQAEQEEK